MVRENPDRITYFAETDARNNRIPFGIKAKDRSRHMYVIGKTGMGKSTLLENLAIQDIQNGEGIVFMDPHGKTADLLLDYVPKERIKDVMYFAPFDSDYPVSFNIMEDVGYDKRHLVMSGLISAFKKIWVDAWSARMEYILGNTLLALLEYPDSTLLSVNRMYSDKKYRRKVIDNVTDPTVKSFWVDEFEKYTDRFAAEATPAIQNKIGQFTSNPIIRNIIGQPKSSFDLREMMDGRKIILVNLSKGRIGEVNSNLLGSMLITKIYLSAMSRADVTEADLTQLPSLYMYVDEFQSFANESFADILSEARKYKLALTLAHQYIAQMSEEVRDAVFGNVGTMISFRVGAYDAEVLEKEFAPVFMQEDMVNLGFAQIYLKLMINGVTSQPFSATTLPPVQPPEVSFRDQIIETSRNQFADQRGKVEEKIISWHHNTDQSADGGVEQAGRLSRSTKTEGHDKKRGQSRDQSRSGTGQSEPKNKRPSQAGKTPPPPPTDLTPAEEFQLGLAGGGKTDKTVKADLAADSSNVNRSALREALAAIAGGDKNKSGTDHKSRRSDNHNLSNKDQKSSTDTSADTGSGRDQDSRSQTDHSEQSDQSQTDAGQAKTESQEATVKKQGREVPEAELRRILEVSEDEK